MIGLGSNVAGQRRRAIEEALEWLRQTGRNMVTSDIYETKPWGNPESCHSYRNAVAKLETPLALETLNELLKKYETEHGRDDEARRSGLVPIDLDIVIWDGKALRPNEMNRDYFTIGFKQTEKR
ncbi:MAG: 2-amino-4-hydroxy-6-hydroxymethyldihydropteridine diphosphokinase [Muribaculaceae bacterium]|nr:2-amino-4-hydroxy-6-hydroxymethyldihydropteridine diphosphokinase [Muribaculaceae bacterium]